MDDHRTYKVDFTSSNPSIPVCVDVGVCCRHHFNNEMTTTKSLGQIKP